MDASTPDYKELTFPIIIMRHGGLDGVALQKYEYSRLLNRLDVRTHVISGREEKEFRDEQRPEWQAQIVIDPLYWRHEDVLSLYANSFTHGLETEMAPPISQEEWLALFERSRQEIECAIAEEIAKVPDNTPVIVYNFLALRHIHPAAAVAIRNVILANPNRGFLSHAADPDAERPEKVARLKEFVKEVISAREPNQPYSGGPYHINNLYHIVLNPTQRANFLEKYAIPENHVFEIPDFLDFRSVEHARLGTPDPAFLQDMASRFIVPDGAGSYRYENRELAPNAVYFLSPVRPVYRKRLLEAMLVADRYGRERGVSPYFIVTHPDIDDPEYFQRSIEFAAEIGMPYIHLGEGFRVESLERAYANLSVLPCVGVVASAAGGWENALNEMAAERIPFFMSSSLNSFKPLTERIGIETYGVDFDTVAQCVEEGGRRLEAPGGALEAWIDRALDPDMRSEMVEQNYKQAYRSLSHEATAPRFLEALLRIYARHGLPGQPGEACEP